MAIRYLNFPGLDKSILCFSRKLFEKKCALPCVENVARKKWQSPNVFRQTIS